MNKASDHHKKAWWRRRPFWVGAYLMLLAVSYIMRWQLPDPLPPAPGQQERILSSRADTAPEVRPIHIRYLDSAPGAGSERPVILLLHGSPGAASLVFRDLIPRLAPAGRVIASDLPGFGYSSRKISDYSFRAHGDDMLRFMSEMGIEQFHVVAYSMGGGVALSMHQSEPPRIRSLTLISSIGVQELELLGDYYLNHALHGAQLAFIRLVTAALPHMGYLDIFPLNVEYAKNFFQSDQRPLRGYLEAVDAPMLIQHSTNDHFVPLAAAREHHRIVPHSELKIYDGGHLMVLDQTSPFAADIRTFIHDVENGRAPTKAMADPRRMEAAKKPFDRSMAPTASGGALIFLMTVIALGTLISEDLTCIGAGLLATRGVIGYPAAAFSAFAGIVIGDVLLYLAGRYLGKPALRRIPLRWMIKPEEIEQASRWFRANGPKIIIASRFLPGSRLPTYFSAGTLETGFRTFLLYFCIAAFLWTPALVGLAMWAGGALYAYYYLLQHYGLWVFFGLAALLLVITRFVVPLLSYRGRRLLLGAWRRKSQWEFWPPYLFYIPVFCYILFLMCRFRSLTLFTAANPGISSGGGFIGESKHQILAGLKSNPTFVARYTVLNGGLTPEDKQEKIRIFMDAARTDFPIVLKPDVGQRGEGVTIIRSLEALSTALENITADTIVQEYVPGVEFGIFYYRHPDEKKGRIFSITDKQRLIVEGDGKSTLERLILRDERAVCMAPVHFRKHRNRLYEVPAKGERITLVELGTHRLGSLFRDAGHLCTPALENVIDRISKKFEGFHFGRFDIRTPSVDTLKAGRHLRIVELNGVTSEATHIYDPKNSLFTAYRILFRQWRLAFEIGAANVKNGAKPTPARALMRLLLPDD